MGGGVNITRHESLVDTLRKGEVVKATGVRLKPNDAVQLHRRRAVQDLSVNTNGTPIGLHFASFEGRADRLILITSESGKAGTTTIVGIDPNDGTQVVWDSTIQGVTSDSAMVHRANQYFVGNDADLFAGTIHLGNRVLDESNYESTREMGPPPLGITGFTIRSAENSPGGSTDVTGSGATGNAFVYWFTFYNSDQDLESTPFMTVFTQDTTAGKGWDVPVPWNANVDWPNTTYSGYNDVRLYRHFVGSTGTGRAWALEAVNNKRPFIGGLMETIPFDSTDSDKDYIIDLGTNEFVYRDDGLANAGSGAPAGTTATYLMKVDPSVKYPLVFEQIGDTLIISQRNLATRQFTVGTMFQESLVVNDPSTSDNVIRWSPPGFPEYQPSPYFMYFATKRSDKITGLHSVADNLIVLTSGGVFRVAYLPYDLNIREERGQVQEVVTDEHGSVAIEASATFETSEGEFVAWLSRNGLKMSDGFGWDDACPDFSLRDLDPAPKNLDQAILVNNPREYRLELYLSMTDGSTQQWDFVYHPNHIKNGRHLKLIGPNTPPRRVHEATLMRLGEEDRVALVDTVNIRTETTHDSSDDIEIVTGRLVVDHPFRETIVDEVGLTHQDGHVDGTGTVGVLQGAQDKPDESIPDSDFEGADGATTIDLAQTSWLSQRARGTWLQYTFKYSGAGAFSLGPAWLKIDDDRSGHG